MNENRPVLTREHLFAAAFFAILLFLLYQGGRILAPYLSTLLWAAILTLTLHPLHRRVHALCKGRDTLAASLMTVLTIVVIIGPAVGILTLLASQGVELYHWASNMIQSGTVAEAWARFKESPLGSMIVQLPIGGGDMKTSILKGLSELSSDMAAQIGSLLKNTLLMVLNLIILFLALFFFFRDGTSYVRTTLGLLPFTDEQKETVSRKVYETFQAVINGVFLIAFIQGLMTGIGFAIFGIAFPAFWGSAAAVLALLPIGGAAIIWLGGAGYLYFSHEPTNALLLALWGAILVSLPDNFLRPLIIGRKAKLPTFLLFLGILGGIQAYGMLGILFGPLVVTLLMSFIVIYREEFAEK
ncbi:MAG: AI-2E family transporter [Nitrospirota bacterium]